MTTADVAAAIMLSLTAILVIGFVVACCMIHDASGREMLRRWTTARGCTLIREKRAYFFNRGPFRGRASRYQPVYRIAVRGPGGRMRTGWARCGNYYFGLLFDEAEAIWDDEVSASWPSAAKPGAKKDDESPWDRELGV